MWPAGSAALAVLALAGCGGSPSGPSLVEAPAVVASPAPGTVHRSGVRLSVPGLPADYVEALLFGGAPNNNPHTLEAWEGGEFKHCIGEGIDPAIVAQVAALISEVTGIPQREDGPCNVTWEVKDYGAVSPGGAYTLNEHPPGTSSGPITGAHIVIRAGLPPGYFDVALALHEMGHAVGLGHSPRLDDVMAWHDTHATEFSPSERAVIAAVYR